VCKFLLLWYSDWWWGWKREHWARRDEVFITELEAGALMQRDRYWLCPNVAVRTAEVLRPLCLYPWSSCITFHEEADHVESQPDIPPP
jgi:hypothetical protein